MSDDNLPDSLSDVDVDELGSSERAAMAAR